MMQRYRKLDVATMAWTVVSVQVTCRTAILSGLLAFLFWLHLLEYTYGLSRKAPSAESYSPPGRG